MENKFLSDLWHSLLEFKAQCAVGIDVKKRWIISGEEMTSLESVIEAVFDCRENEITTKKLFDLNNETK